MTEDLHIAIAGATGAVGIEMLKPLEKRHFPVGTLTPLASARAAQKRAGRPRWSDAARVACAMVYSRGLEDLRTTAAYQYRLAGAEAATAGAADGGAVEGDLVATQAPRAADPVAE